MPEQIEPQPQSQRQSQPRPQQVRVPYPPDRYDRDGGRLRDEPEVSAQESYRRNIIRVALSGEAMIDVVPVTVGGETVSSADPATAFGAGSPVWIMSGCNAFGRLCTARD